MNLTAFLVCHDYGQGAVWARVWAQTEDAVRQELPQLAVFTAQTRPAWMTEAQYIEFGNGLECELGDLRGWLASLRTSS